MKLEKLNGDVCILRGLARRTALITEVKDHGRSTVPGKEAGGLNSPYL